MDVTNRAYSLLDIKSINEGDRVIEGMASTPTVDRVGDIVEPMGAQFKVPMPLLLDHDNRSQVGHVEFAKPTKAGIPFKARIVKIEEAGEVKSLTDKAWHLVKAKLRAAVSIGFRPLKDAVEFMDDGGMRFKEWEWLELSLVSVPANSEAVIYEAKSLDGAALKEIKSIDAPLLAASGTEQEGDEQLDTEIQPDDPPAATGKKARVVRLDNSARDGAGEPFTIKRIVR